MRTPKVLRRERWPLADQRAWEEALAEGDIFDGRATAEQRGGGKSQRKRLRHDGEKLLTTNYDIFLTGIFLIVRHLLPSSRIWNIKCPGVFISMAMRGQDIVVIFL